MGRRTKEEENDTMDNQEKPIATIEGWEDGAPYTRDVTKLDRWELQSADRLTFHFNTTDVTLVQDPHSNHLGGYIWLTAIVFCTYLENLLTKEEGKTKSKRHEWIQVTDRNKRWVELGSGVGLIGIMLAKLGIEDVTITDIPELVDIMETNVQANGLHVRSISGRRKNEQNQDSSVVVEPLFWGNQEHIDHVKSNQVIDYLVACDCIYSEASAIDLVMTMDQLATPNETSIICVSEVRNQAAQEKFLEQANAVFTVEALAPHAWQNKACSQVAFNETLKMYRMYKGSLNNKRGKRKSAK